MIKYVQKERRCFYGVFRKIKRTADRNLNAQIVFGVCDLLYYASNIIDERAEDMYTQDRLPVIDKKQRREIRAKKHGLTMGGM